MLSRALVDHYRCPENLVDILLRAGLSSEEGYFRFGPNITCYGRSCAGTCKTHVEASLYDAMKDTVAENGRLTLPFDPSQIIDNLRLERYVHSRGFKNGNQGLQRRMYYLLRPLTTLWVRKQVQRFHARNWQTQMFPRWPLDASVEDLTEELLLLSMKAKGINQIPFVWFWPGGARACMMMTHDVETAAGLEFCAKLMDLDDSYGVKASFQIVPEGRYKVPHRLLDTIRGRGFGIGIQDLNHDGRLFDGREEFLRRARLINRYGRDYGALGFRSAVLYRKPEWYQALDFRFDMSIPNVAHLDPQRGGCCTVMPFYIGSILEIPVTTIQDYTLFHLLDERSIDLWKVQVDSILKRNGLASFIVHPDYILDRDTRAVYEELLAYLRNLHEKGDIWSALPDEIDSWWRARSKMSVVRDANSWRIVGPGAERAVLAYARNVDGRLVYETHNAVTAQ